MTDALKYEWTRLTTLRSTWWVSIGSLVAGAGFTFFMAMALRLSTGDIIQGDVNEEDSRFILEGAMTQFSNLDPMFYLLGFVSAIMGVLCWGHEYRHGMIRATLTAVPQRWAIFTAKYLVVGAWIAALVVISCMLSLLFTVLWFSGLDLEYDAGALVGAVLKRVLYSVLLAWLAMSLTALVRHQTFALVMIYLWPMGIETVIKAVVQVIDSVSGNDVYEWTRFLPFNAGGRIMQNFGEGGFQDDLEVFGDPLSALGGFLVFGGFTFALTAAAYWSFEKRDA
jgi:ABC-2 type transport system permease protein